ncbi:MAG TPA: succino-amino-deoxyadenylate synthase PurZ [Nocardioidaceae bacterium]|nr:succino-amino-deoxyadenylate synthase PurZ [Nocardioidaceae bacterium]
MGNNLDVVVGGQYGSESKGRVTADLVQRRKAEGKRVTGVRVAGPNAGHVVIDENGERYALRQVPVSMVVDPDGLGIIAAGSEIDLQVLDAEIADLERGGHKIRNRLLIDAQATILEAHHRDAEGGNDGPLQTRIGSTGKGIGAARADRIWRQARIAREQLGQLTEYGTLADTAALMNSELNRESGTAIVIEGTQGYGLGLHAGYYPQCTSSDCRAIDFLAMAGVSPWGVKAELGVWVVLRAYPIRVAGNSGPLKGETSWAQLGLPEEHTTVTHKVRRVGQWDSELARAAVQANGGGRSWQGSGQGPVRIALAMADQRFPQIAGAGSWSEMVDRLDADAFRELAAWIDQIESECAATVASIGTGPSSTLWRRHCGVQDAATGWGVQAESKPESKPSKRAAGQL